MQVSCHADLTPHVHCNEEEDCSDIDTEDERDVTAAQSWYQSRSHSRLLRQMGELDERVGGQNVKNGEKRLDESELLV